MLLCFGGTTMLAIQVAIGIVMAVSFLGLCLTAFVHRSQIVVIITAAFRLMTAPIWRHRITILIALSAAAALAALGVLKSDARRAVLDTYRNSQAVDYRQPSPFLERYGK
jgi:hypothetical protein